MYGGIIIDWNIVIEFICRKIARFFRVAVNWGRRVRDYWYNL